MKPYRSLLMFILVGFSLSINAQIVFPTSNVLNLVTSKDIVYLETHILFNTGKYISSDYNWEKVRDSLDTRWLITSCFNGDCKNDLVQSGSFIKDFGITDFTCFIAFHVQSFGYDGKSVIVYKVYNRLDSSDSATLFFNITYKKTNAVPEPQDDFIAITNPVQNNRLTIKSNSILTSASIITMCGLERVIWNDLPYTNGAYELELPEMAKGIYYVKLTSKNGSFYKRIELSY